MQYKIHLSLDQSFLWKEKDPKSKYDFSLDPHPGNPLLENSVLAHTMPLYYWHRD